MAMLMLVAATPPAQAARAVKVIEPMAAGLAGAVNVVSSDVTIGDAAKPVLAKLEAKAADKRAAAKLPPYDPSQDGSARPPADTYETLPLASMLSLEIADVTREWGLTGGRPVKLALTIDTLKTVDAGMAMLLGSSDELSGMVTVLDATDGKSLSQFYVDVLNFRSGMLGLAMRGGGVREKLAAEFSKHIAEQLSGSKRKPKAKAS